MKNNENKMDDIYRFFYIRQVASFKDGSSQVYGPYVNPPAHQPNIEGVQQFYIGNAAATGSVTITCNVDRVAEKTIWVLYLYAYEFISIVLLSLSLLFEVFNFVKKMCLIRRNDKKPRKDTKNGFF